MLMYLSVEGFTSRLGRGQSVTTYMVLMGHSSVFSSRYMARKGPLSCVLVAGSGYVGTYQIDSLN